MSHRNGSPIVEGVKGEDVGSARPYGVAPDGEAEYGWEMYGEFKILFHKKSGYVNGPKLCELGGKKFKHWLENKSSKALFEAVGQSYGGTSGLWNGNPTFEIQGGLPETRGTYIHPFPSSCLLDKSPSLPSRSLKGASSTSL